jgi:hypothetical protein
MDINIRQRSNNIKISYLCFSFLCLYPLHPASNAMDQVVGHNNMDEVRARKIKKEMGSSPLIP